MKTYTIFFEQEDRTVAVLPGTTLLNAMIQAKLVPDAPCGGRGSCGKCRVLADGREVLACQTTVDKDITVQTGIAKTMQILTEGQSAEFTSDSAHRYALAFDVGTTSLVGYLLDGSSGEVIASAGCMNPQGQYGADVISRIQYALNQDSGAVCTCVRNSLSELTEDLAEKAGISPDQITSAAIAGNTAMHHLLLGIDPKPLVTPPYMPKVAKALTYENGCHVRVLPNIAGFVGGDTVGCMVATRFDRLEELTLLIDIGTNGEMVLGNSQRIIACSTAAGPAFEGAKISCGMRAAPGAVDHVWLEDGQVRFHVIGDASPVGLCGSGLLDLIAVLLELGTVDSSGRLRDKTYTLCENVVLTRKDVREVQLAKAAIRAGITLLAEKYGVDAAQIQKIYLAGAFGNYMNPESAYRIGMIPPILLDRIQPIGNAAGEGAKLCAISREAFAYSSQLAEKTEFLELASLTQFQQLYIDSLEFPEAD